MAVRAVVVAAAPETSHFSEEPAAVRAVVRAPTRKLSPSRRSLLLQETRSRLRWEPAEPGEQQEPEAQAAQPTRTAALEVLVAAEAFRRS